MFNLANKEPVVLNLKALQILLQETNKLPFRLIIIQNNFTKGGPKEYGQDSKFKHTVGYIKSESL